MNEKKWSKLKEQEENKGRTKTETKLNNIELNKIKQRNKPKIQFQSHTLRFQVKENCV